MGLIKIPNIDAIKIVLFYFTDGFETALDKYLECVKERMGELNWPNNTVKIEEENIRRIINHYKDGYIPEWYLSDGCR